MKARLGLFSVCYKKEHYIKNTRGGARFTTAKDHTVTIFTHYDCIPGVPSILILKKINNVSQKIIFYNYIVYTLWIKYLIEILELVPDRIISCRGD